LIVVADASALIALLDTGHVHNERAIEQFAELEAWVIHPVTLAEVLVHPASQGREVAETAMLDLFEVGMVLRQSIVDPVMLAEMRVTTRLKMPDCLVMMLAVEIDAERVLTFDDRLDTVASKLLTVR
jgi:predicted nucleic acid-binding protein